MKTSITIYSNLENSETELSIQSVERDNKQILLTISSISRQESICILIEELRKALDILSVQLQE